VFPSQTITPKTPLKSRRTRPAWAKDDRSLMLKVLGQKVVRRWNIARMYWRENKTAREIASELQTTERAVKNILNRIRSRK
jgi:hypothetical protein